MKSIKNNVPENYHILDHISNGMDEVFNDFTESETNEYIKQILFKTVSIKKSQISNTTLDLFEIEYTNEENKITMLRKDLILLLCAFEIENITGNRKLAKDTIKELQNLYFSETNSGIRIDLLNFHIANMLTNRLGAYLYIIGNNIARFANIDQYLIFFKTNKPFSSHIIIDLPKIIYSLFNKSETPDIKNKGLE